MKLYGEIQCTIDKNHPDIKYVKDWTKDKVFKFHDKYTFDESYGWTLSWEVFSSLYSGLQSCMEVTGTESSVQPAS